MEVIEQTSTLELRRESARITGDSVRPVER
jgi:hypothetical protein